MICASRLLCGLFPPPELNGIRPVCLLITYKFVAGLFLDAARHI